MSANPHYNDDRGLVGNEDFKAVLVALDVKYDLVLGQKACGRIAVLNLLRRGPSSRFRIREPVLEPPSSIRMLTAERLELVPSDDSHARSSFDGRVAH